MITEPAPVMATTVTRGAGVVVYATGQQPNLAYPIHIHAAPCGVPAPVQYALADLVADAAGRAITGAGITDMVPLTGVSLYIHAVTFEMIACGNV